VYEGTMEAVQASGSPLNATLANQPGGAGEWLSQDLLRRVHEYASDAARLVSSLRGQPVELPIGFDRVIEGQQITVGIVGMVFRPDGRLLECCNCVPAAMARTGTAPRHWRPRDLLLTQRTGANGGAVLSARPRIPRLRCILGNQPQGSAGSTWRHATRLRYLRALWMRWV
jgi:hypothetical protein